MSGIAESAKGLSSPQGKAQSQAGQATENPPQTPQNPEAPRSMPDDSGSNFEASNSNEDNEGEMVPAAGRINEKGEVIDDDGTPIGKVTSGEASKFAGFVVTQEGDILDNDGGVVGKAEPLEDVASELNYTTKSAKDTTEKGSRFGGLGSAVGGAGQAASSVAGGVGKAASGVTGAVGDTAKGATDTVGEATGTEDATGAVGDNVKGATDTAGEGVEGATGAAGETAENATGDVGEKADDVGEQAEDVAGDAGEKAEDVADDVGEQAEGVTGDVDEQAEVAKNTDQQDEGIRGELQKAADGAVPSGDAPSKIPSDIDQKDMAEGAGQKLPSVPSLSPSITKKVVAMFEGPFTVADGGKVTDQDGKVIGKLAEGSDIQDLVGKEVHGIDEKGNLLGENDTIIGKVDIAPEGSIAQRIKEAVPEAAERLDALDKLEQAKEATPDAAPIKIPSFAPSVAGKVIDMFQGPFNIAEDGQVTDQKGKVLGKLAEGQDFDHLVGKDIKGIDEHGNLLGDNETQLGKVDLVPEGTIVERIKEEVPEAAERLDALDAAKAADEPDKAADEPELPNISILEGLNINKAGNVVDEKGNPLGKVISGDIKKLVGKSPDKNGKVWDSRGNIIGEVEVLPEAVQNESTPFEDFPDAVVDKFGKVIFDGRQVGVVVGDDFQKLIGKKVDADGDILDSNGNVIGHAERQEAEEEAEPEEEPIDYSSLVGKKINKMGNVVDDKGQVFGHVVQGILKNLIGKKVGEDGQVYNDAGKVIGKCEPIPESELEEAREPAPFEDFPNAVVADEGAVMFNGEKVGIVVEGDAKKLKGKTVDPDGDILDRAGNQLGRAERWEAPEEEPEPEIDMSALAGKRINKAGNAVDKHGDIYGRVIEGSLHRLVGKMCDKQGFIRNEGGDVIGKCELIPEAEREGMKEGPFTELSGCTVNKEGKVVTPGGDVVGILTSGDPKALAGRPVDDDGDILDKNGNVLGHAERYEEPEVEKEVSPMAGKKVNKAGNVIGDDGEIMGKLTSGELGNCVGKKVDNDGNVVDQNGTVFGHVSLLDEIPDKEVSPMSGRRVNREGNVVDENGDLMGKLVSGDLGNCIGKTIDDDGDVVDQKGNVLGHCSMLADIAPEEEPEPEPTETDEEREARLQKEQDRQLAIRISSCIELSLEKIRPILHDIRTRIDMEEAKSESDRDEDELVKQVRPLIEEGGKILTEANGVIRGLDPDGRITSQAKGRTATREATPEEYHLADLIKELTGSVTETIENAKRKLENLPKAKKHINPLWGLLSEPLFQIIAAVGLLLSGVLGLVGKLLNGLGLGGLVNNLLGGLGITNILDNLGLGSILGPITGGGKKKK
ncbi:hypothetical protein F5Y16DRAFT_405568 [Xylariaceae sp. FL0255]|nr:hypothetical protein F5Y16DRAFT_405568 [Xylariaceae sp. FL0255]